MTDVLLVYVTVPEMTVGRQIAASLLEKRLIACANILPGAESHYRWEGKLETSAEAVMFLKTKRDLLDAVMVEVEKLHPYACSAVLAMHLEGGRKGFLDWVLAETV
ncbi:MAG: divalent-cation tolerance protein CutA [Alphaproteobacteria bacterium]|nr:divalent-cation tolerance protein CutA [Alphaproteobacteria bacterium]